MRMLIGAAAALCALASQAAALAQDTPASAAESAPGAATAAADAWVIPAGHPIELETGAEVSSKLHQRGYQFPIRLASALVIDGVEVLPAGVTGIGEVTSAAPSGMGGRAGELMINARYLEYNGLRVPLRGMKIGLRGQDNTMAALAVSYAVGPFALFVTGGNIVLPAGTFARAKVAQSVSIPRYANPAAASEAAVPAQPAPAVITTTGN